VAYYTQDIIHTNSKNCVQLVCANLL